MHICFSYNSAKIQQLKAVVVDVDLMKVYVEQKVMEVRITVTRNSLSEWRHHMRRLTRELS